MIVWLLKLGITILIHNKDDIEFVTEFPCFLGHPVFNFKKSIQILQAMVINYFSTNSYIVNS